MGNLVLYYCFIVVNILIISGFLSASSLTQIAISVLFLPLAYFFWSRVFPHHHKALVVQNISSPKASPVKLKPEPVNFDRDRRMFIKIIGSAGITLLFFSLFTKKAHAAFFGSIPGPGTISLKDSTGVIIDPAIKQPTDGYRVSQVDDSTPSYYGFVDRTGRWYIMREDGATGNYRYVRGSTGFITNWTNRTTLTYDYFNIIFA